jgi:hypothetical protein
MTSEEYLILKDDYIDFIKNYVIENGGISPQLSIFADIKKPTEEQIGKSAIVHIPIPEKFMENDMMKEMFIQEVVPDVFSDIKKEFIPQGVAWAAEAWMRVADKDFDMDKDEYKKLPIKKEVIIITIESVDNEEVFLFEIKRDGKQVNSEGNLTDAITLTYLDDMKKPNGLGGRFSGLFKKFNDETN